MANGMVKYSEAKSWDVQPYEVEYLKSEHDGLTEAQVIAGWVEDGMSQADADDNFTDGFVTWYENKRLGVK